jgi:hypothetical protein
MAGDGAEHDPPRLRAAQAFCKAGNTLVVQIGQGKGGIRLPDRPKGIRHIGPAEQLRLKRLAPRAQLQHLVDQDFHRMRPIAQHLRIALSGGRWQQKVVHAADLWGRIPQADGNAGPQHGRQHFGRVARHPEFALDDIACPILFRRCHRVTDEPSEIWAQARRISTPILASGSRCCTAPMSQAAPGMP